MHNQEYCAYHEQDVNHPFGDLEHKMSKRPKDNQNHSNCCKHFVISCLRHRGPHEMYQRQRLSPVGPVQRPVLDCFRDVLALNLRIAFHVRDGARDFQYPVVGAGAESLLLHGAFQHAFAVAA